jgi:hypothetical protein
VITNLEMGRDSALYALFKHFEGSGIGIDRIRICPREDCRNVFVLGFYTRTDRVRYCSIKCSRLMASRAFRESKNKGKKKAKQVGNGDAGKGEKTEGQKAKVGENDSRSRHRKEEQAAECLRLHQFS